MPDPFVRHVVANLVHARITGGVTAKKVRRALGWSRKRLERFEDGGGDPFLSELSMYAHAIGVMVMWEVEDVRPTHCAHHATVLASRHLAHLDPDELDRMRADYANQCPECLKEKPCP